LDGSAKGISAHTSFPTTRPLFIRRITEGDCGRRQVIGAGGAALSYFHSYHLRRFFFIKEIKNEKTLEKGLCYVLGFKISEVELR